jgi:FeS assembly SUF system protein
MSFEYGMGSPHGMFAPQPEGEEMTARAGAPLPEGTQPAARDAVIDALRTVYDPEIPVNIYELGLVYEIEMLSDGSVRINMSLTAPACPVAGELPYWVANAAAEVEGVGEVEVNLIWDPPWSTDMMSDDAKLALGID